MMNHEKTLELVDQCQREDRIAFALLVTEFQSMVFGLAFQLLCDEGEARDTTQETFVKVWLSLRLWASYFNVCPPIKGNWIYYSFKEPYDLYFSISLTRLPFSS